MEKADWKMFTALTHTELTAEDKDVNELVHMFNEIVCAAAKDNIPQTKGMPSKWLVPWWTEQCTIANRERKSLA